MKKRKLTRSERLRKQAPNLLEVCKEARWQLSFGDLSGRDLDTWATLCDQLLAAIHKVDPKWRPSDEGT